jgi:hypothetical protein
VAVLVIVAHAWGLIWLLIPVLLTARRVTCHSGAAKRHGQLCARQVPTDRETCQ